MPNSKKMNVDLNNSTDINKTPTSGGSKSITETSRNTGTSGTSNASNTSKDNIRSEINKGLSNCSDPDLKSDPKKRPELKPEHKPIEEHTSSNHYLKPDRRDNSQQTFIFISKSISGLKAELKILLYGLIFLILIIGFFLNQSLNELKNITEKTDTNIGFVLASNSTLQSNIKAFNQYPECFKCHNDPNLLLPKTSLTYDEFLGYVRGNKRFVRNTIMPTFSKDVISDQDLEQIWKTLY